MAKSKSQYVCNQCGGISTRWTGQCQHCKAWNSLEEQRLAPEKKPVRASWTGTASEVADLRDVEEVDVERRSTGMDELDRVLGGGLVPDSVTLLGGDPGVGKSTLLLQTVAALSASAKVLYVTGEESLGQVRMRARRLGLESASIRMASEVDVENILATLEKESPSVAVIDSVQTLYNSQLQSAPGSVAQVRECAAMLTRFAKTRHCAVILVGHVTKDGTLAGPRVLEHMVDTVLHFEGDESMACRMLRATKNRFGPVNELGLFMMGPRGLDAVDNPSSLFLTQHEEPVAGSAIFAAMEGQRPFLVEIQALVEDSDTPNPRRYVSGLELHRLQMLLAVLGRHAGLAVGDQHVFTKAVGGVKLVEPAADLPWLLAIASTVRGRPLPGQFVALGEVGLAGEVRAVAQVESRLKEAAKLGFTRAMIPAGNERGLSVPKGMHLTPVARVQDALDFLSGRTQE